MAAASTTTKNSISLFIPGPVCWELWKTDSKGVLELAKTTEFDGIVPGKVPAGVHFAFPVATAFAVPFWASTDDPALLADVGDLQLEKLRLKPDANLGTLREYHVVDQVGSRSLAVATVLNAPAEMEFSKNPPEGFQVSPMHHRLPSDAVTVWRELGRLVMAVTRNDTPVYFQSLSSSEFDAEAIQAIRCVVLQLGTQEAISGIDEVVLRIDGVRDPKLAEMILRELRVPARFENPVAPILPKEKGTLVPEDVAILRHRREVQQRWRKRLTVAGLVYLVVVGFFVTRLFIEEQKAAALSVQIQEVQPEADAIRRTQMRWDSMRLAIDADAYPIETMLKCVQLLPPRGVRLTEFEYSEDVIVLKGEASSAPEAIKFKGVLTSAEAFRDYEWNFPPPVIVPNKGATFQTSGKSKYASTENQ